MYTNKPATAYIAGFYAAHTQAPETIEVSSSLFEAYKHEVMALSRIYPEGAPNFGFTKPLLMFKSCKIVIKPDYWTAKVIE
jgi:hypothetical protein